ncbi:MAG: guanylate kinase [Deltaproteobacteria bacterium]|nr:guanylate kinase [Deltaproteobacteria bacterium]
MGCRTGHLFVLSAPSGAGKTTLCKALREVYADIQYSVSHTTRKPRQGEKDGIDYHFIDEKKFLDMRDKGCWAEWAKVHGHYYGTSANILEKALLKGHDILLDIDVQGTLQILKRHPDAVTIFIMAPSLEILKQRLMKRGTEDLRTMEKRLRNAAEEIAQKSIYRHVIVNDELSTAREELIRTVGKYRHNKDLTDAGTRE